MNTRGWLQDKPEIASPARTDTLDHYGPAVCGEEGCELPARYHGRCYRHWRRGMEQETKPADGQLTDEQQREAIDKATSNAAAMKALGMPPGSGTRLARECKRLGCAMPSVRTGTAAKGHQKGGLAPISPQLVAADAISVRPAAAPRPDPTPLQPIVPVLKAVEAVAVILRTLPTEQRGLVAETAARIASAA